MGRVKKIGLDNRLKLFSNVRYFNDRVEGYLSSRVSIGENKHLVER